MYTVLLNLWEIQILTITFHICSLINYGFVSVIDTCVFCIAFVDFGKTVLLYHDENKSLEILKSWVILKVQLLSPFYGIAAWPLAVKLLRGKWMTQEFINEKSTLLQATIHYLSQSWLRFIWTYGAACPQWVKAWCRICRTPIFLITNNDIFYNNDHNWRSKTQCYRLRYLLKLSWVIKIGNYFYVSFILTYSEIEMWFWRQFCQSNISA